MLQERLMLDMNDCRQKVLKQENKKCLICDFMNNNAISVFPKNYLPLTFKTPAVCNFLQHLGILIFFWSEYFVLIH